jgi:effector-associated domain 2 (EAD2)-containing protein/iSTAND domain-containing protein
MSFPDRLDTADRHKLVEALLECDCMKTPQSRDQVLAGLPREIERKANRSQNNKWDVDAIVHSCLQFPDGMKCLFSRIKFFEEETSRPWQSVQAVLQEIKFDQLGRRLGETVQTEDPIAAGRQREQVRMELEKGKRIVGQMGSDVDRNRRLDEVMHLINFTRLKDFLAYGDEHYTQDGFAALCVIQQTEQLGGEWCLNRIRDWLGKQPKEVGVIPLPNGALDEARIRNRLAEAFGLTRTDGVAPGVDAIIQRICGSFHQDRRILVTIQPCDEFQDETWTWMMNDFWRCFIREFQQSKTLLCVRVMVVLMTDLQITSPVFAAHCCDSTAYHPEKITRLPLDHWTKSELLTWLGAQWGENRTDNQLKDLAEKVYQASDGGKPWLIYNQLKKRLTMEAI